MLNLEDTIEPNWVEPYLKQKATLQEDFDQLKERIRILKDKRKDVPHHIAVKDLPEQDRFEQLSTQSKHFIDTIKMTAYRAERAMANLLREEVSQADNVPTLLRGLYNSEADLIPDPNENTLTIRLHHQANLSSDQTIQKLCDELNATETIFPRTKLRMVFKLGSN